MGYRIPPPTEERMHFDHTAVQCDISVDNGTISYIVIPCFYLFGKLFTRHEMMLIDHHGWPSPDSVDRSFQMWWVPRSRHIDLDAEGYDSVEIVFGEDEPDGLSAIGSIDVDLVRVTITSMCDDASETDVDVPYFIYVKGNTVRPDDWPDGEEYVSHPLRNLITKGTLHISAGAFDSQG